jgi:hypothetical protein
MKFEMTSIKFEDKRGKIWKQIKKIRPTTHHQEWEYMCNPYRKRILRCINRHNGRVGWPLEKVACAAKAAASL